MLFVVTACGRGETAAPSTLPALPDEITTTTRAPDAATSTAPTLVDNGITVAGEEQPAECILVVSDGARVTSVFENAPADGVLQTDDLIIAIDELRISSVELLLRTLRASAPGDEMQVTFARGEEIETATIELGSRNASRPPSEDEGSEPNADPPPDQGFLGVMVESRVLGGPPDALADGGLVSALSRPVWLADDLFLLDAPAGQWVRVATDQEVAQTVGFDGDLWVLDEPRQAKELVALVSGDRIAVDAESWDLFSVLGTVDRLTLIGAGFTDQPGSDALVKTAVLGVELPAGRVVWEWEIPPAPDGEPRLPVVVFSNFGQDAGVLLTLESSPTAEPAIIPFIIGDGTDDPSDWTEPSSDVFPADGTPLGWWNTTTVLYRTDVDGQRALGVLDVGDGTRFALDPAPLAEIDDILLVYPVGDGQHMIVVTGADMRLVDMFGQGTRRLLATGCSDPAPQVADLGAA